MGVLKGKRIGSLVLEIYLLCYSFRVLEYFILRTDQTWIGEAIVHKIVGIIILLTASAKIKLTTTQIGFIKEKAFRNLLKGIAFGCGVFALAYGVEMMLVASQSSLCTLQLYVSTYAISQNTGYHTELLFFLICVIGNIVNVIMEEGVFRGLFAKLLEQKYSFVTSTVIASSLFGFWHMIGPIRNYADGTMGMNSMLANIAMLVLTSALVGFKLVMLTKVTGSLFMAMGDHFVNNTIVNLLHVVSDSGVDEMMVVRIAIAQSVSFVFVLIWYIRRCYKKS